MLLVCQKYYSCTNTKSRKAKRQVLLGYELYKHLAATVLGGLLLLYLIVLAQKKKFLKFNFQDQISEVDISILATSSSKIVS